jgi:hypothetical protein
MEGPRFGRRAVLRNVRFFPALLVGVVCAATIAYGGLAPTLAATVNDVGAVIPKTWLQKKISVAEAEAAYPGVKDDRVVRSPEAAKPFGFRHRQWEELKAALIPGDEIWTFASPPESWTDLAGRAGVALVRNGVPIKVVTTAMN